jgi:MoxR-like ATPase
MKRSASARLAKLMTNVVKIEKARLGHLLAELSGVTRSYAGAVDALTNPDSCFPAALAAMSCRSLEAQMLELSQACAKADQKLLEDGRQLKLFEARALHVREQEAADLEREHQAQILERITRASLR